MQCLFLNIASHKGFLACVTENAVVSSQEVDHKISDAELIPAIEGLLKDAEWTYQDLTHIVCVTGPGGFTSLRVAVTYANVLADQLNLPLAGIHLSDLYAARTTSPAYWFHSTKKLELFVRGAEWKEPTLLTLDQLVQSLPSDAQWMGELLPEHEAYIQHASSPLRSLSEVLPACLFQLSFDKKPLEPWYGRGW